MRQVLILCTGNSCRSQMAEVIWNHLSNGDWLAVSAGSAPAGYVHPLAILVLDEMGLSTQNLTSKSSDPFLNTPFDLVVTVCDNARDACPIWPKTEKTLHWPFPDPADAEGDETQQLEVFRQVRDQIKHRIESFIHDQSSD